MKRLQNIPESKSQQIFRKVFESLKKSFTILKRPKICENPQKVTILIRKNPETIKKNR